MNPIAPLHHFISLGCHLHVFLNFYTGSASASILPGPQHYMFYSYLNPLPTPSPPKYITTHLLQLGSICSCPANLPLDQYQPVAQDCSPHYQQHCQLFFLVSSENLLIDVCIVLVPCASMAVLIKCPRLCYNILRDKVSSSHLWHVPLYCVLTGIVLESIHSSKLHPRGSSTTSRIIFHKLAT